MGCRPTSFDDHPDVGGRRRWFCEKARSSAYHQNYEIGVATKTWLIAMFKFKSSHHRPRFVEAGASFREKTLRSCVKSWLTFGVNYTVTEGSERDAFTVVRVLAHSQHAG
jgi:hypothetical protein